MSDFVETLSREFRVPEYRHAYSTEFSDAKIATQIKVLREQRGWTQTELAQMAGMKQSRISALENVNYDAWSVSVLRRLASAFDVALDVRFESFGDLIYEIERFSRESLQVVSFENDLMVQDPAKAGAGVVVDLNETVRDWLGSAQSTSDIPPRRGFVTSVNSVSVARVIGTASSTEIISDKPQGQRSQFGVYQRRVAAGGKR